MFSQNEFEGNFFKVNSSSLCDFISALAALPMRNKDFTHPFSISLALSRFHSHTHTHTLLSTSHQHMHTHARCFSLSLSSALWRTNPGAKLLPPNLSVDVTLDLPPYNKF